MIIILSATPDTHADQAETLLKKRGVSYLRIDADRFSESNSIRLSNGEFSIQWDGKQIPCDQISAVWLRKPFLWYQTYHDKTELETIQSVLRQRESSDLIKEFLLYLQRKNIYCINNFDTLESASYKLDQLSLAREVGLQTPDTLVTTNPDEIETFIKSHNDVSISKCIRTSAIKFGQINKVLNTTEFTLSKFQHMRPRMSFDMPYLFQEKIEKQSEIRAIVVGERVFSGEILSQEHDEARIDMKKKSFYKMEHRVHQLPEEVEQKCIQLMKKYGIVYGAIDLIRTPDDQYVFLEVNSNGQYLWIEELTGMPITEAIIDLLTSHVQNLKEEAHQEQF
jgi:glutathione synthase/RimK-type ligase-like ATP-grasp enzyme